MIQEPYHLLPFGMMAFDPHKALGLSPEDPPEAREAAYARRLRETDPARVQDMDPRVRRAAIQCRAEVELAYRMVTEPEAVDPAEVEKVVARAGPVADVEEDPEAAPLSYVRAIVLTLVMPGAGSWYAAGRTRGLVVLAGFSLVLVWVMKSIMATMQAQPNADLMMRVLALQEAWGTHRGLLYGAFGLALADALVAVWAHNDRLSEKA